MFDPSLFANGRWCQPLLSFSHHRSTLPLIPFLLSFSLLEPPFSLSSMLSHVSESLSREGKQLTNPIAFGDRGLVTLIKQVIDQICCASK